MLSATYGNQNASDPLAKYHKTEIVGYFYHSNNKIKSLFGCYTEYEIFSGVAILI